MNFDHSEKVKALQAKLNRFMDEHIYPNEPRFDEEVEDNTRRGERWTPTKLIEGLKPKARAQGLWNLWWPHEHGGELTNLEYAPLCEIMGRVFWAPEVFNCSAPDTGNMETLIRYGSEQQKQQWLQPLGEGKIFMGKTNPEGPRHAQQSMILIPRDTPGVTVLRPLMVFGYDDAPHGHAEVLFENVRVPASNILLGEGRGFEIAQGRLGPGRIHHCMRAIGAAERALELMCKRTLARVTFGKPVAERTVTQERIAEARIMIDAARLLTLKAAHMMDTVGNKAARAEIAMIKVYVPNVAQQVMDWAIQAYGGGGVSDDFPVAWMYAWNRVLRLADGPDEVHRNAIAKLELAKHIRS
jgi:acyl-CoA dehydrogenase